MAVIGRHLKVGLPVQIFKEGEAFVAYCPPLDLSSYGSSIEDAKEAFEDALEIFLVETTKKGTLEKELLRLGWTLRSNPNPDYRPPKVAGAAIKNRISKFLEPVSKFREMVNIPVAA